MEIQEFGDGNVRILLIPGGPGLPTEFYRELIDRLAEGHRVYTYRGIGVWPDTEGTFPRTVPATAKEMDEVIATISERDRSTSPIVLLGHSFGSAVALEYLTGSTGKDTDRSGVRRPNTAMRSAGSSGRSTNPRPPIAGTVLVSPFSSGRMIDTGIRERVAALPDEFHAVYQEGQAGGEEFQRLLHDYWLPRHFCRVPWPDSLLDALGKLNSAYMAHYLGDDLFDPSGELLSWSREDDLSTVGVPTLIMSGEWDYYRREDLLNMQERIPRSELWIGSEVSHAVGWSSLRSSSKL
jgi:pimeloyl-ACP methyl ester carboxylesterase